MRTLWPKKINTVLIVWARRDRRTCCQFTNVPVPDRGKSWNTVRPLGDMREKLWHRWEELWSPCQPSSETETQTHQRKHDFYKNSPHTAIRTQNLKLSESKCRNTAYLTANGSACSQEIGKPKDDNLIFSGRDSGTTSRTKRISSTATMVARRTTTLSPYQTDKNAPMAGLVTKLAANVAET